MAIDAFSSERTAKLAPIVQPLSRHTGGRYRTRRHQNQIRDARTVRVGHRRGNFTLDDDELVRCLLVGLPPFLDFDDDDKLLGVTIRNRYRRVPTPCDVPDGRLDVVRRVVTPIHDQVLDAADDEQLVVKEESRVPGAQPRPLGCAGRGSGKPSTERTFGLVRFPPIAHRERGRSSRMPPHSLAKQYIR